MTHNYICVCVRAHASVCVYLPNFWTNWPTSKCCVSW